MNKRQAKRWVLFRAALILQSAVDSGWPFNGDDKLPPNERLMDDNEEPNANGRRILQAIEEVVDELETRGGR
jgi:hypothetical protein